MMSASDTPLSLITSSIGDLLTSSAPSASDEMTSSFGTTVGSSNPSGNPSSAITISSGTNALTSLLPMQMASLISLTNLGSTASSSTPSSLLTSTLTTWLVSNSTALITDSTFTTAPTTGQTIDGNDRGIPTYASTTDVVISEDIRRHHLDLLQEETTRKLIPTIVFLVTMAVVGCVGNSTVLMVYSRKTRRNATDIFIMAIAAFDLLTNTLAISGEIYDTFHYWDFDIAAVCKFRIYFNSFTTITSALVLLAVAVSRYKKVCKPFGKQTTTRTAQKVCVIIALVCAVFAMPQAITYGLQTKPTQWDNIFGQECSIDDMYVDTIWPMLYMGFLMFLFLGACIPLIVLYILIGVQAWRHSQIHGIPIIAKTPTNSGDTTLSDTLDFEEDSHRKSKVKGRFSFLKKKHKYDVTPGDSSTDDNLEDDEDSTEKTNKNKKQKKIKNKDNGACETLVEEAENGTKFMRSPTKDKSHVNFPMLRELNFRLTQIKSSKSNADEVKDDDPVDTNCNSQHENDLQPNEPISNEPDKSQDSKDDAENGQKEEANPELPSDFAASMQWVDITYCLNDEKKVDEQDDANNGTEPKKKVSLSRKVSRENSLRRKLADTLTRAKKAKKESIAMSENNRNSNDFSLNTASTMIVECEERSSITFNDTVVESDGVASSQRELKSGVVSQCNTPGNGTLKESKPKRKKSKPHRRVLTRTTLMLIIISAVYVIAFLPHLVVISSKLMITNFWKNMSSVEYSIYNVFLRFYFLNSAANAIIYSICDARFREQIGKIIRCQK